MDGRLQKGRSLRPALGAQEDRGGQAGCEGAWAGLRADLGVTESYWLQHPGLGVACSSFLPGPTPFSAEEAHLASIQLLLWTCWLTWAWCLLLSQAQVLTWARQPGFFKP